MRPTAGRQVPPLCRRAARSSRSISCGCRARISLSRMRGGVTHLAGLSLHHSRRMPSLKSPLRTARAFTRREAEVKSSSSLCAHSRRVMELRSRPFQPPSPSPSFRRHCRMSCTVRFERSALMARSRSTASPYVMLLRRCAQVSAPRRTLSRSARSFSSRPSSRGSASSPSSTSRTHCASVSPLSFSKNSAALHSLVCVLMFYA